MKKTVCVDQPLWWHFKVIFEKSLGILRDSPRAPKRAVVINTRRFGRPLWGTWDFMFADFCTVTTTARLEDYDTYRWLFWPPFLVTERGHQDGLHHGPLWVKRPIWTSVLHIWRVNRKFPEIWYFGFDTHFDVRGITISPPWEHSSSNVVKATWSIEYRQPNNSTN